MTTPKLALLTLAAGLALTTAACSKSSKKSTFVPPPDAPVASKGGGTPAPTTASETLTVADDLAARCALKFGDPAAAPRFGYDEATLAPSDRDLLDGIATCLTTGPLKGKSIQLVGRADPRGTTEYNMGLGSRRAQIVGDYLRRLGVAPGQLAINTRGDLDARGEDEAGWELDRRVDLEIRN